MSDQPLRRAPDEELLMHAQQAKEHLAEKFHVGFAVLVGKHSDGEPCRVSIEWGDGWTRLGLMQEHYLQTQLIWQDAARIAVGPPPTWIIGANNASD